MEYSYTYMEYNYIFLGATHKQCTWRCHTQTMHMEVPYTTVVGKFILITFLI